MELFLTTSIIATIAVFAIAAMFKTRPAKLEEAVMETSHDRGELVLGKRVYESSDVTVVAVQETSRE